MLIPRTMLTRALVRLNNRITRWRRIRTDPAHVLLLVAHCLQHGACGRSLTREGGEDCARCGRCQIGPLLDLGRRLGVTVQIAGGGRQALAKVRGGGGRAVVAVACERELLQGICGVFPTPVLAVCNTRPQGDCHDTRTELAEVETALHELIHNDRAARVPLPTQKD